MGVGSDEETRQRDRQDRVAAVAVFRFQLISAAVDEDLSARARGALVREIAEAWHTDPFGRRVQFSRDTLDRWIRMWRQGGFEALVPSARMTPLRTDTAILALAEGLKRENPARTAAQVERILVRSQGWSPSQSTLLRLFHRLELPGANGQVVGGSVFGRFEAGEPNQMWTGDALHGKRIGGRKTYLFAFIDDHSRFVPGYRWGFAEDAVRLAAPLRAGLENHGIPQAVYVVVLDTPCLPPKRAATCRNDTPWRSLTFQVEARIVRCRLIAAGSKKVCGERWRASPGPGRSSGAFGCAA